MVKWWYYIQKRPIIRKGVVSKFVSVILKDFVDVVSSFFKNLTSESVLEDILSVTSSFRLSDTVVVSFEDSVGIISSVGSNTELVSLVDRVDVKSSLIYPVEVGFDLYDVVKISSSINIPDVEAVDIYVEDIMLVGSYLAELGDYTIAEEISDDLLIYSSIYIEVEEGIADVVDDVDVVSDLFIPQETEEDTLMIDTEVANRIYGRICGYFVQF